MHQSVAQGNAAQFWIDTLLSSAYQNPRAMNIVDEVCRSLSGGDCNGVTAQIEDLPPAYRHEYVTRALRDVATALEWEGLGTLMETRVPARPA